MIKFMEVEDMKKIAFGLILGLMVMSIGALALPVQKTDGFVCPVIKTDAVLNSPKGAAIGEGHFTIGGPDVNVPLHATNGDGAGTPPGPHSAPGDIGYTAVWAKQG